VGWVFSELQTLEHAEVAIGGLAFEVELIPGLGGKQIAQLRALLRGQGVQQVVLLGQPKVDDLQAFLTVFGDQIQMAADVGFVAAVFTDDDLDLAPHTGCVAAVVELFAYLIDAFEAGLQVRRAIRYGDAEDEAVTIIGGMAILATLPDQGFLFAEQRLIAGQQRMKVRRIGPHSLFQQGIALLVKVDERIKWFGARCLAGTPVASLRSGEQGRCAEGLTRGTVQQTVELACNPVQVGKGRLVTCDASPQIRDGRRRPMPSARDRFDVRVL